MTIARIALALPLAAIAAATPSVAAGIETYKDWLIGCDNTKSCTAVGRAGTDFGVGAYVVVRRDAGPGAAATMEVAYYLDDAKPGAALVLSVDDPKAGVLPKAATRVDDNGFLRATYAGADAQAFTAALRNAAKLKVAVRPGGDDATSMVSLAGMSAALLKMDDVQGRVGTVTALIKAGPKPASAVPAAPPLPVVKAVTMTALDGKPPAAITVPSDDDSGCNANTEPEGVRLSPTQELWGVCASGGAYNFTYDYAIVENGHARAADFPIPAGLAGDDPANELVNAGLDDGGKTLSSSDKGRGIGDCGVEARWAWDGKAFQLVEYSAMDDCFGVVSDDWPVLWRVEVK